MKKEILKALIKIKEQIVNNEELKYNPAFITGVSKEVRADLLFRAFNKDFNQKYKAQIIDLEKDSINDISIETNCLLIIDNIDEFVDNEKIAKLTDECLSRNIQVIKFANKFQKAK